MTMTKQSLQDARKVVRDCEASVTRAEMVKMDLVKEELIEFLHQLSLLPASKDDRLTFYEKLEDFLTKELFSS